MKQFDITYFHGPFASFIDKPEVVADIAASGITLVPLNSSTEVNKRALPVLARYGLRALVGDPRIDRLYRNDDIAGADEVVRAVVCDYAAYGNILGWDIVDEPNTAKFPVLSAIVNAFRRYAPQTETVINLFPNYATPEQLGAKDFTDYLERFVAVVRPHFISYDHYHFLGRENRKKINAETTDERERLIRLSAETTENRGGFFENIEECRRIALKYGLDAMLIVLLTEHGPYRNLTRGELLWEVNMCLAYGMRRISYFTYWEPSHSDHWQWTNAMCDTVGNKMQHWYDVQSINAEISPAGRYLFDKRSTEVYHTGTPEAGSLKFESFGAIAAIDGENGVIGFFDDGSAYLTNRDFLKENTFVLDTEKPFTVQQPDGTFADAKDPVITLPAGGGCLIKF